MKKTSKVLFLVGAILTIFAGLAFLGIAIGAFVAAGLAESPDCPEWINKLLISLMENTKLTRETCVKLVIAGGAMFIVLFVLSIPACVLSFICSSKEYRPLSLLIVSMVFATLSGSALSVAGGIVGIVNWSKFERKEQTPQVE